MDVTAMPELEGVEHHFLDVRGASLHVAEMGSGPPVVLLHGWPQHWWTWRALMPLLAAAGYRAIAPDMRGFGWSEPTPRGYRKEELADDVAGILDALDLDRVSLAGQDWGGVVGFLVCLNHTDRVQRYVPMNTGHVWPTLSLKGVPKQLGAMAYQGLLASPVIGRRINASPRIVGKVVGSITKQTDAVMPQFAAQFAPRFADPARARAASQVYRTFQLYEYPRWVRGLYADRRLTTPTMWLHGLSDPFFKPGMFKDIVEHADDVRIEYLPDCGHFPQEEQPRQVADLMIDFLVP
jgi:pimeloyl-ACP methyl ester carboxylesterase